MLELISVHSRIAMLQRLINIHNEKTTANYAGEPLLTYPVSTFHSLRFPVVAFFVLLWSHLSVLVYKRQKEQKEDLLKKKILLLSRDESNTELSKCATQQNTFLRLIYWF